MPLTGRYCTWCEQKELRPDNYAEFEEWLKLPRGCCAPDGDGHLWIFPKGQNWNNGATAEPQTIGDATRAAYGEGFDEADLMAQEIADDRAWLDGWNEDAPDTLRDNLSEAGFGDFGPM